MSNFRIHDPALVPEEYLKLVKSPRGRFDSSVGLVPDHAKIRAALEDPLCEFGLPYSKHTHPHECNFQWSGLRQIPGVERLAGEKE